MSAGTLNNTNDAIFDHNIIVSSIENFPHGGILWSCFVLNYNNDFMEQAMYVVQMQTCLGKLIKSHDLIINEVHSVVHLFVKGQRCTDGALNQFNIVRFYNL